MVSYMNFHDLVDASGGLIIEEFRWLDGSYNKASFGRLLLFCYSSFVLEHLNGDWMKLDGLISPFEWFAQYF